MDVHGKQLVAGDPLDETGQAFHSINPSTDTPFGDAFYEATSQHIDQAMRLAEEAFDVLRTTTAAQRGDLLDAIADEIMELGDALLERAHQETGLPMGRLTGERGRAVNQTRLFANVVREGSWVNARIDTGNPDRTPAPKPDVRSMLVGIGPVVVFGASNFPLAISVAGTDTISALGAGCPVVAKAHPGHPGTCDLLGQAIQRAVERVGLPAGCFSMVQGKGYQVGIDLVKHPSAKAVAFTGSLSGGRALFDAAAARPEPIPVYAEMGSTNPVFLLPGALEQRAEEIAKGYVHSVNLGVGQFCTNPGIVLGIGGEGLGRFTQAAGAGASAVDAATMLHAGITSGYRTGVQRIRETEGVGVAGDGDGINGTGGNQVGSVIFTTDVRTLNRFPHLIEEEVFGPTSIVVACDAADDMERIAENLEGHLTATVHGTDEDLQQHQKLVRLLEKKVGRLIFNGFPTGIEVCAAMHHGGPYPATTDSHYTSIGTGALLRFGRPLCYQNFPDAALPAPLQNKNVTGAWRLVNNEMTREDVK